MYISPGSEEEAAHYYYSQEHNLMPIRVVLRRLKDEDVKGE